MEVGRQDPRKGLDHTQDTIPYPDHARPDRGRSLWGYPDADRRLFPIALSL